MQFFRRSEESSACFIVRDGDKQALALADVRELLRQLPKEYRAKDTWGHVAKTLDEAARSRDGAARPGEPTLREFYYSPKL